MKTNTRNNIRHQFITFIIIIIITVTITNTKNYEVGLKPIFLHFLNIPRLSLERMALDRSFHHRGTTNEKCRNN